MAGITVLTGDLIGSTRVSEPAAFRARLAELLVQFRQNFGAITSIYRGDGFQVAVDAGVNAFELAILLRTGLLLSSPDKAERWDARIGLAFGSGELSSDDQQGEAYVASGRTLDNMDRQSLCVHHEKPLLALAMGAATRFADQIISQLTPAEAEVLYLYFLNREGHQQIADQLGKKRPTVTAALQRANYQLLDQYAADMHELVNTYGA